MANWNCWKKRNIVTKPRKTSSNNNTNISLLEETEIANQRLDVENAFSENCASVGADTGEEGNMFERVT